MTGSSQYRPLLPAFQSTVGLPSERHRLGYLRPRFTAGHFFGLYVTCPIRKPRAEQAMSDARRRCRVSSCLALITYQLAIRCTTAAAPRTLHVDDTPDAARLSWGEADRPLFVIDGLPLTVYPAEAERFVERLAVGNPGLSRPLLVEAEEELARGVVMLLEPAAEGGAGIEEGGLHCAHGSTSMRAMTSPSRMPSTTSSPSTTSPNTV
jgi:hypothetical protein